MAKKKFEVFLGIMETFFAQQGYQKSRRKGEYHKAVCGKLIKVRIVLSSVRNSGNLGEIRVFTALEYPEVEKMAAMLQEVPYKKGNDLFSEDIAHLCGALHYYALNYTSDSNMENTAAAMQAYLVQNVFPVMDQYEEDKKILDDFAGSFWRPGYFRADRAMDFYMRWIALCAMHGYIREAFAILENIPRCYGLKEEKEAVREKLKTLCSGKEQTESSYLFVDNDVYINPTKERLRKGLFCLDGLHNYYMIFENSRSGNYLQIAGGSGEYAVEIRLYHGEDYVHCRAEVEHGDRSVRRIFYGSGCMEIPACQVLSIEQADDIVCRYLENQKMPENYNWAELNL